MLNGACEANARPSRPSLPGWSALPDVARVPCPIPLPSIEGTQIGSATMSIPKELRPADEDRAGIQFGFYLVRISKRVGGQEVVPTCYNQASKLGQETSQPDLPKVVFALHERSGFPSSIEGG